MKIFDLLLEGTYGVDFNLGKKYAKPNEQIFAGIHSGWSWEYDSNDKYAFLYFDWKTGDLRMIVVEVHTKTGIGKGRREAVSVKYGLVPTSRLKGLPNWDKGYTNENVGTLLKPELGRIQKILKEKSHDRSRAGSPFGRIWLTPKGKELKLKDQILAVNRYLTKIKKHPLK